MLMKIIKPGKAEHWVYRGECRACGCVFEALERECEKNGYDPLNRETLYGCACPTCRKNVPFLTRSRRDGPEPLSAPAILNATTHPAHLCAPFVHNDPQHSNY